MTRRVLHHATRALGALLAATLLASAADESPAADAEKLLEYRVKAAFLFNFAKFTEWPASAFLDAGSPIVIAVLGQDPFGPILEATVEGKRIGGRAIVVRRFARPEDLEPAHILFAGTLERGRTAAVLLALSKSPTLTVGDDEGFIHAGGMVRFVRRDNKVRFQIDVNRV
ncbi:MAG: YfiR family protein, partial [Planctomycetes bacterium]|nr:YfiR family protein [Planctomycetota bacterium]